MNRRGFFGLLGKLVAVGAAMSVAPELLAPAKAVLQREEALAFLSAWYGKDGKPVAVAVYTLAS